MRTHLLIGLVLLFLCLSHSMAADGIGDLIRAGRAALSRDQYKEAVAHLTKAIEDNPKAAEAWFLRARAYEALAEHKKAIKDYSKTIELEPKNATAYNQRGSEHFKLGHIKESVEDFDRYLKLRPQNFASHWKRGISLYYAGKYKEGEKQFNAYEQISTTDVENAVWHFLCAARRIGPKKAQKGILKISGDRRVPMMKVYELYKGEAKPLDVLKTVEKAGLGDERKNHALFYAHLYLGLYHEAVEANKKKALEHLKKAEKHKIGHYMWDVAHVHRIRLEKEKKQ